jgi:hypothetical protein
MSPQYSTLSRNKSQTGIHTDIIACGEMKGSPLHFSHSSFYNKHMVQLIKDKFTTAERPETSSKGDIVDLVLRQSDGIASIDELRDSIKSFYFAGT